MSTAVREVRLPRVIPAEQATELVGLPAEDMEPTSISPGTLVRDADTNAPVVLYVPLDNPAPLRRAMLSVPQSTVKRQRNYTSRSRTFGYAPRRPVMGRESCGLTSLTKELPEVARLLESYADQFSDVLTAVLPDVAEANKEVVGGVLPEWRMGTSHTWTSGVINDTAQLPYHRDGFNFPVWSAMPVLRRGTRGGYLHIPEYGIAAPCSDATVTYFEGFKLVHGVTPITYVGGAPGRDKGYRVSVVYYALRGMKNCRDAAEETAYGRERRTERERDMASRLAAGDRSIPT